MFRNKVVWQSVAMRQSGIAQGTPDSVAFLILLLESKDLALSLEERGRRSLLLLANVRLPHALQVCRLSSVCKGRREGKQCRSIYGSVGVEGRQGRASRWRELRIDNDNRAHVKDVPERHVVQYARERERHAFGH